jgi:hypothetical protein
MPSTQYDIKGRIEWAKVFESNRDRAEFHQETDGMYKVTVATDEATMKSLKKAGLGKTFKETDHGWSVTLERPHKGKHEWQGGPPIVADITGKAWNLEDKGFIGNGSEGIVKFELYDAGARKGSRLLGLQVLDHVVYESEGGSSQPRSMFSDHSQSSGGSSSSTSSQEPQDSIPF